MTLETGLETALKTVSGQNCAPQHDWIAVSSPRLRQTLFRRRLPRFVRAKRSYRPPLALQDRDLELLRAAYEYRLITTPQYLLLFREESRDGIYRRLQRLFHHGYLDRLGSNPNAPLLYALGQRGAAVLDVPDRKARGDRYINHQLMIGNVRLSLTLTCRERGINLGWRRIEKDLPVRPDGFFSLQFPALPEGQNRSWFMLEADLSTMPRARFIEKLMAYQAWHEAGGHTGKLGIRNFRVLTVTKSFERLKSLLCAAATPSLRPSIQRLWFTSTTHFAPTAASSILDRIWEVPATPAIPKSLIP